jgi:CD36 family
MCTRDADAWVTSSQEINTDNPDFFRDFYFWNLTNYDALIAGTAAKPVFENCGPYSFT